MSYSVVHSDCLAHLRTMDAASIDAVVTDPPYELGFMGKKWDSTGIAYRVDLWAEVLRVLKPGAHLVAFGGSRTYHRMACAIEDAGFQIRDSLMWLQGTGFPKSLNVSKAMDEKGSRCACSPKTEHRVRTVRDSDVSPARGPSEREGTLLFPGMPQSGLSPQGSEAREPRDGGIWEPGLEGRSHVSPEAWALRDDPVCSMPAGSPDHGEAGRLRNGASPGGGPDDRKTAGARRGGSPREPQPNGQHPCEPVAVAGQPKPQASGAWPRCAGCGLPVVPDGIGTALKPAHEPVVLARKPLGSTVEVCVALHGTGGLNIDACRIAGSVEDRGGWATAGYERPRVGGTFSEGVPVSTGLAATLGRWPANLLLDEAAAAMLDAQGGELTSGFMAAGTEREGIGYRGGLGCRVRNDTLGDSGGASRFFYTAKPSRDERDAGLDDLEPRSAGQATGRGEGSDGLNSPRAGAGRTADGVRNHHPTVKPVAVMEWLIDLVTPLGGLVLDPFCGSGTTGIAAVRRARSFVGIEREAEYVEIATRRIAHWSKGQLDLLGRIA